ncbi:MAG TPA: class I SAM-dependent methyltransferase [Rhizomicrobium sp.]|nr:class I SAM-dependent methyltransferase [Rhizomicrobium sp.]
MNNIDQIEHWNGPMGKLWASRCDRNEYRLANIQAALLDFAAPEPGMNVLDIGCGCGLTSLALAEAVTPGSVTGLDVSAPMLDMARRAAAEAALDVRFVESDAAIHPFRPEYDLVFSRFGVMFFADPVAAFANIRGALKPGGRLAFSCWRAMQENPWTGAPFEAARALLPPQPPAVPGAPGQFAFADGDRVASILGKAGFSNVAVVRRDLPVNLGSNLDEAADESINTGALSRAASGATEEVKQEVRARVRAVLAPYAKPEGVAPPGSVWFVSASA